MSDLPGINRTEVSFFSWWNATEHGVSSIDPTDVQSYGEITAYTEYDNGVEGEMNQVTGYQNRTISFRVRDDGWFMVWFDRTESYGNEGGGSSDNFDNLNGMFDIVEPNTSFPITTLSQELNNLAQELSNYGDITFRHIDVSLYNFKYENTTRLIHFRERKSTGGGSTSLAGDIYYIDEVEITHWEVFGRSETGSSGDDSASANFDGFNVSSAGNFDWPQYGLHDVQDQGLAQSSGQYYENSGSQNAVGTNVGEFASSRLVHVILYNRGAA